MKQIIKQSRGFTLVELLVVISIIALLAGLSFPALSGAMVQANLLKATHNGQELYKAALAANLDANNSGNFSVGFPADMNTPPTDALSYINALRLAGFLDENYYKLMAVAEVPAPGANGVITNRNLAFSMGVVGNSTSDSVPFFTTKNFTPVGGGKLAFYVPPVIATAPTPATPGAPAADPNLTATTPETPAAAPGDPTGADVAVTSLPDAPFKDKGFAVIRKGGDAGSYKPKDISSQQGGPGSYTWGKDPSKTVPPVIWLQTPKQ